MARTRMAREDRYDQLVTLAWSIVRTEGADALTLGRLAEHAEITKPVVYSHFSSRAALLIALFEEYEARQNAALEHALDGIDGSLQACASAIATSHVDCALGQGRELTGVAAALEGAPELAEFKRRSDEDYAERCRSILTPFAADGALPRTAMTAILGAAEALGSAAASQDISREEACDELADTIVGAVSRVRGR